MIMESYEFLLFLAVILFATKMCGLFSRKFNMPQVVGALIAGIILGPSVLNWIDFTGTTGSYLEITAEIGVILLMFSAGLGTDLTELKKNGIASFVIALVGVVVPLLGGFVSYAFYFHTNFNDFTEVLKAVFVGVVLTATSVSITVETLREMGKLKGRVICQHKCKSIQLPGQPDFPISRPLNLLVLSNPRCIHSLAFRLI